MTVTVCTWDDALSWNAFVATLPDAHFQQSWQWGELAPELGGQALRYAATEHGRLVAAMQLFLNPIRGSDKKLLYVPRGPSLKEPCLEVLGPLVDAARLVGIEHDAIGIRLEPNVPAGEVSWRRALETVGLHQSYPPSQPRSSWVLDLSPELDALLAGMKQKTRYNIRLAARKGVEVSIAAPGDLYEFYELFQETAARDDFFVHPVHVYGRMFALFREFSNFAMLFARYNGELIAAITLVCFGPTCWYLQGASSNRHRNLMATYLLQWEGIQWAREQGCTLYDFRAVPDLLREDQDMYGVYRFKEGFGGRQLTTMHTYTSAYQPGLFGLWQLYFSGRFALDNWRRRRHDLPIRQFA